VIDTAERTADWIITEFIDHRDYDLRTLKKIIAADLRYAYQQGRADSAARDEATDAQV
jgi:hypothetical protein